MDPLALYFIKKDGDKWLVCEKTNDYPIVLDSYDSSKDATDRCMFLIDCKEKAMFKLPNH